MGMYDSEEFINYDSEEDYSQTREDKNKIIIALVKKNETDKQRIKELEAENKSEYKRGLEIGKKILEDKVIAENQRLREALEKIVKIEIPQYPLDGPYRVAKEIAQKALESK